MSFYVDEFNIFAFANSCPWAEPTWVGGTFTAMTASWRVGVVVMCQKRAVVMQMINIGTLNGVGQLTLTEEEFKLWMSLYEADFEGAAEDERASQLDLNG